MLSRHHHRRSSQVYPLCYLRDTGLAGGHHPPISEAHHLLDEVVVTAVEGGWSGMNQEEIELAIPVRLHHRGEETAHIHTHSHLHEHHQGGEKVHHREEGGGVALIVRPVVTVAVAVVHEAVRPVEHAT